ncbi:MAG: hypothetical protein BWX95_02679 [Bacteroidetes bacterium ADurb.Bin141]|nr:MAG: hypothetical protein BWX95_02679 [Bacteroidetes bacterium ADurb.Bin141]
MASIGFADSSLAAECMLVRVILNPTCAYRNVNVLPNLVVIMQNLCNDTIVQTASRIHSFTGQSTSDTIVWNGQSDCTDCFTLNKTASVGSTAIGDTITFNIQVCSHNATADTVVIQELLPSAFTMTASSAAFPYTNTNFPADTCMNYTVSGYYTTVGSCPDSAFTNHATLQTATVNYVDSVCVEVVSPCANIPNSITLADSSFSLPMNSNYSNTTFVVQGRFYINDNLTLINCHIYTYPAAQIIVLSGGTFSLYGTTVEACTQMWQGIQLQKNSTLIMSENSIVRDAENGITALHGSAYQLKDSRVIDCVRSIYVPQQSGMNNVQAAVDGCKFGLYASTFKPDYAGQPAHESLHRACIEVYDVVMTIEGKANRNEFYNSNWGIYAHRSYVVVSNCKFNNMRKGGPAYGNATHKGAALVAESTSPASAGKLTVLPLYNHDITIDTCQWGVYTEWTNATVTNVSMRNVNLSGVFNIRCNDAVMSTTISNCDIEAAKTGIQWQNSEKGIMKAVNNRIKVWSGGNAVGIKLISTGTNTGNYQITGNTIEATNGSGITASSAKNVNVINNTIKLSGNTNNGVSIAGCDSSQVSCNAVSGRYPVFGYQNKGISISHSTANFMNCNNVDSTYLGVYFEGVCTGTRIRGTEMKNHFEGLRLFSNAVIDTQAHAGNLWVGSFNNYGANNLNYVPSTNLLQSAFLIDYSYGGVYIPTVPVNNAGWIIPQTGNEFDCSGYLTCMDVTHETIAATALQLTIAEDSLETAEFTDESKIMARNYLYKDIKNNDSLVNSNYSLNAFLAANENMVTGKLYDVSNGINLANSISETEIHDLMAMDNFTDNIIQSITSLDSIAAADSTINLIDQREILMQQLNTVIQDKQNLMYMLNTATQQALSNVQVANSSIITNNAPDEYEQIMNDVEIEYEIGGMAALQNKCSQVFDIAVQCPHIGGKAVYKARSYVALMNDTIEYDDVTVCAQAGFRKSAETRNTKEEIKGNIKIVPNPTNEKITVTISDDMNGMCEIQFNDVVGKSVLLKELDCNQKTHTLNIKLLSEGIYTVKVNQSNHVSEQFKLIIVR